MKRLKQLLSILIVIILAGLYISSLIFALIGSDRAMACLKASIYATIVLPVLLWTYIFIYRLIKKPEDSEDNDSKTQS